MKEVDHIEAAEKARLKAMAEAQEVKRQIAAGLREPFKPDDPTACPDCGVKPGEKHHFACDVVRCVKTGLQRLSCDCGCCGDEIWTGCWPG